MDRPIDEDLSPHKESLLTFIVLVVIFKCKTSKSDSLLSLAACGDSKKDISLFVWDNSPIAQPQDEIDWLYSNFPAVIYEHHPENLGLSVIYNRTISRYLRNDSRVDYLILLDQDSSFSKDLLHSAKFAGEVFPGINLFIPRVSAAGDIVSPARLFYFYGRACKNIAPGLHSAHFMTAINSGMVIRGKYLRDQFPGYDERLKFYGTDNDFMQTFKKSNEHLCVTDATIIHDLARNNNEETSIKLWRHHEIVRSTQILNSGSNILKLAASIYCMLYSLKTALVCRNWRYLRWIFLPR